MARKTVSPKSTGGAGDAFEGKVAAWWALHLLVGQSPLDPELGSPRQIRLQARVDGWLLDDLVVDFPTQGGVVHAAVSVKSARGIKGCRAPADFVRDCWEMHLNPGKTDFNAARDRLFLAMPALPVTTQETINTAIDLAASQAPDILESRLDERGWCNNSVRMFIRSFACPEEVPGTHPVHGRRIGALLRALRVRSYDFARLNSEYEARALRQCQDLVANGGEAEARVLWDTINRTVKELRPGSGVLTLETLLDRLRGVVTLKNHPDYAADWALLARLTVRWREDTRDTIGGDIHLPRPKLRQQLANALNAHRVVAVLGESGGGKSVLVKEMTSPGALSGPAFCLHADEVARSDGRVVTGGTGRPLDELLPTQPNAWALLVLDGLDRVSRTEDLRSIARAIRTLRLGNPLSPWRLLVTCQKTAWDRLRDGLRDQGAELDPYVSMTVGGLEEEEVLAVARGIRSLAPILLREELRPLTAMPKVLDLLARAATEASLPDVERWVGESNLIRWFWERYLRGSGRDPRHTNLLQRLGRLQADSRCFATPTVELPGAEAGLIPELERLGVIVERDEGVHFAHDIYADYARQRYLLGQWDSGHLDELRERVANPLWHRAIRLLGLGVLEVDIGEGAGGIEAWRRLIRTLGDGDPPSGTGADLLLEAVAFASQPGQLLGHILPDLRESDGALLKRFLTRFLYATTAPHPVVMENLRDASPELRAQAAAHYRAPDLIIWIPVVRWITQQRGEILELAPEEFLEIAEVWLLIGRQWAKLPLRLEIGTMVLTLAERAAIGGRSFLERVVKDRGRLYRVALLCGSEHRERIVPLIRRLSGRAAEPAEDRPALSTDPCLRSHSSILGVYGGVRRSEPWPDGPRSHPDTDFQEIALTQPGADWLIEIDPELAKEVFFALLIEPPGPRDYVRGLHECELQNVQAAWPPFYDFAPAQQLLARHSAMGLEFVVELVNFATDRWVEESRYRRAVVPTDELGDTNPAEDERPPGIRLTINGEQRFYLGDGMVFEWHLQASIGPNVAAAVLMALEHWLYEQAGDGRLAPPVLEMLLRTSRSVAVIGVLFDLALKDPSLLVGSLEPLVEAAELYSWGRGRMVSQTQIGMLPWGFEPPDSQRKAFEWHSMPHRGRDFLMVIASIFAKGNLSWPAIERARQGWSERRESTADEGFREWLEMLLAQFDPTHWKQTTTPEGEVALQYVAPEELVLRAEQAQRKAEQGIRALSFPMQCRRILNGEEELSEENLPELLGYAAGGGEVERQDDWDVDRPWAIRCGAAAVAVLRFPGWLNRHPGWRRRCRSWLLSTCLSPPAAGPLDTRHSIGGCSWDSFCAEAIPALWSEEPEHPALRRAMAALVGAPHDDSALQLFMAAARFRHRHPEDFQRLLHLAVWFARLMAITNVQGFRAGVAIGTDPAMRRLVGWFVNRSLTPLPANWLELASAWPKGLSRAGRMGRVRCANRLDEQYLAHAFAWLQSEARNTAAPDRMFLVDTVEALVRLVINRVVGLGEGVDRRGGGTGPLPYESDYTIAGLAAAYAVNDPDSRIRARLWQPWLHLPRSCSAVIEVYLEAIYREGLDRAENAPHFLDAISDILEFALGPEGWKGKHDSPFWERNVASALLGRERFGSPSARWTAEREPIARALGGYWIRWAEVALKQYGYARTLLELLATPAAKCVRREALIQLAGTEVRTWTRDERAQVPLVALLEILWRQDFEMLMGDAPLREPFEVLLRVLVDLQNPRAILLSQEIASASRH